MKISVNWLRDFIDLHESAEELDARLTASGLEVEGVETIEAVPGSLQGMVIGEVLTCEKHPDADKLSKTTVDLGSEVVPIVCGAPNVAAGQKVVVATVGATLYPAEGEPFTIKKAKIRGEVSQGMICAEDELGLGASHAGIMVLDTDLPNGTPAADYFHLETDYVLEIGLTPNRADAASHLGVARDLRALYNRPITKPDVSAFAVARAESPVEIVIEAPEGCPRYCGVSVHGVTVGPSPEWLQQRLRAIGLSPINNVVDVTNYVLHGLGQPLHAFDEAQLAGHKIVVRYANEGETLVTLDDVERKLSAEDLVICDGDKPVALAGVFGGAGSGVTEATTNVFIESAYFAPGSVRRTAQRHGLKTDASFRFERGTDPELPAYAAKYAALLLQEVAGGTIVTDVTDNHPRPVTGFPVDVRYRHLDRLLGVQIPHGRVRKILELLDIRIEEETDAGLRLWVPPYRVDVQREADVAEELLRIYGYDQLEVSAQLRSDFLSEFPAVDRDTLRQRISTLLTAVGFTEIQTNSLTRPEYAQWLGAEAQSVPLVNPLSEELSVLRQHLLFTGLEVMAHNLNRRQTDLRLFEFGRIYQKTEKGYQEADQLILLAQGNQRAETWQGKSQPVDFFQLGNVVTKVLRKLGADELEQVPAQDPQFAWGLTLRMNRRDVATLGLVKTSLSRKMELKSLVFCAVLDWDYLTKKFSDQLVTQEISRFPEVRRDLSLVLDRNVTFEEIRQIARKTERRLLRDLNVFDVYEGESLGAGKKSYSVSFILQDQERTLTDKEIDKTMDRLMKNFERELGAVIRR